MILLFAFSVSRGQLCQRSGHVSPQHRSCRCPAASGRLPQCPDNSQGHQVSTLIGLLAPQTASVYQHSCRTAGIPWSFSPVVGLGIQPLWPRFYETVLTFQLTPLYNCTNFLSCTVLIVWRGSLLDLDLGTCHY